jgi:ATP-dependent DNA helicase RecG
MSAYDEVAKYFPLPKYHIGLVHGQLKPHEKENEMKRFKDGITQILMATTVIEVGVNVPNANVMIIVNSERFGLSQLHQLRGRVGRSSKQAYCVLMTGHKLSQSAKQRIDAMVSTTDGFELAEMDLKIRGPGEIDGTKQSGLLDLNLSSITKDEDLLIEVRECLTRLLNTDVDLKETKHRALKQYFKRLMKKENWRRIS